MFEAWRQREARRRWIRWCSAAALTIALFLVALTLEAVLYLPPAAKIVLWVAMIALFAGSSWFLHVRLPSVPFERGYAEIAEALDKADIRYALDLHLKRDAFSPKLQDASIRQLMDSMGDEVFTHHIPTYRKKHPFRGGMMLAGLTSINLLILVGVFAVYDGGSLNRMMRPLDAFSPPNPFTFTILPADTTVEQGLPLPIQVVFDGDRPRNVTLAIKSPEEAGFRRYAMNADADTFRYDTDPLFTDQDYRIEMDGFLSEAHHISVALLPRFSELMVRVRAPAYTRLEAADIPYPISSISVYPGSELEFIGTPNVPLTTLQLHSIHAEPRNLLDDARFRVMRADSLWFTMTDTSGLENRNRFSLPVRLNEDLAPVVNWIQPAEDLALAEPGVVDLIWDMRDDFGITTVAVAYDIRREFGGNAGTKNISIPGPHSKTAIGTYELDLIELGLRPMDEIRVRIVVTDNDAVGGRHTTVSAERVIRIASLTELLLAEEQRETEAGDALTDINEAAEETRRMLDELKQDMIDNPRERVEQIRDLEQMKQQREELGEKMNELREQMAEMREESETSPALSDETRELYEQLEQMAAELEDPELEEAIEELMKAMEQFDPNQMRQAMENLEFNEQKFRERIERTMELFKQLRTRAELDRMAAQLESLEKAQEQLQKEDASAEEIRERQQDAQEQLDSLKERMESLEENAPKRMQPSMQELSDELKEDAEEADKLLDEQVKESQESTPDSQQMKQQQKELQQRFNQMKSKVQQAGAQMSQEQVQLNTLALLGIMQQLLWISDAQESLMRTTTNLTPGSTGFVDAARQQNTINRIFSQVADSLFELSKQVPRFSNSINDKKLLVQRNAASALRVLSERDRARALAEERFMLAGMNEIGSMLADLLEQLQDPSGGGEGGGGGGMGQTMEQMGKNQQQLNQQMQDMLNDMAGQRLMQDGNERLDQMARQQNAIRRQLEELQRSGGLEPGDPLLEELERLNEEMEDAINDLRGGAVDRVMVQRQQNILSRMLQVEKAFQEREEDDERKGREADPIRGVPPGELTPQQLRDRIRDILNDPNFTRYTDEYQRLILRYFELMEQTI